MLSRKNSLGVFNSYVAPNKYPEFQLELFILRDLKNQKFGVGLVVIDMFTKYMVIIPIGSKNEANVASGNLTKTTYLYIC